MTTTNYDAMQAAYEAALNAGSGGSGGGGDRKFMEDGDHTLVIKDLKLDESEGKTPALIWTVYAQKANVTEDIYRRLTDRENDYKYGIIKDLRVLGITPPQSGHPKELFKAGKAGVGATIEGTKKTGTYQDKQNATKYDRKYYFNRLISAPTATPVEELVDALGF